ncbi:amidase [Benzoatithermus flavus]|uniref:Amidase family protein n=1 Tax=Benzoatithermus flavus TaxID=3108223 RepID=A0ABU8XVL3_9PROT
MPTPSDPIRLPARTVVRLLERGEISPLELIDAALARIAAVDPLVNAVPTLCPERARAHALRLMEEGEPEDRRGRLAGLPVLIKDMVEVAGVRTTFGSPIFEDHVPERSAYEVERIEARGGIVLGKTNTPEFAAGANTFNEVFGVTRNPWNRALTCGGSSGGSAVALATGMAWLADGSDLGGSLRTPASFCGVVGLRPSPGRVPSGPAALPFDTLSVEGPMARDVRDLALFLDTMAGFDPRDPLSFAAPVTSFAEAVERPVALRRVAFSPDLGGITPVDAEVAAICRSAARRFGELGAEVVDGSPDLKRATEVFTTLRAARFAATKAPLLERHRDLLKPEVIWNIEHGLQLDAAAIGRAERERGELQRSTARFFEDHDLLLCPAAIVPPFACETRYLEELNGHRFPSYVDWIAITYAITLTGCPALSLPCGFTGSGLPVGLQIVGPPRGEAKLLAAAAMLEDLLGVSPKTPIDPHS